MLHEQLAALVKFRFSNARLPFFLLLQAYNLKAIKAEIASSDELSEWDSIDGDNGICVLSTKKSLCFTPLNLPFESQLNKRSAVFLPTPGILVSLKSSSLSIA